MKIPQNMNSLFHGTLLSLTIVAPGLAAPTYIDATNDFAVNGESFFGASNITSELTRLARRDSVIAPTATFRQIAVSGALIAQIQGYYKNATPKPKYLISDGGGNDLMSACPAPADSTCPVVQTTYKAVKAYFDSMATGGTKKVLWMRYPDPQGTSWATLKTNQDLFNPLVKSICDTVHLPKCYWIDLRNVWGGHYAEYTSDGIHPTTAGGTATAEAFWKVLMDSNFFDLSATAIHNERSAPAGFSVASGRSGLDIRVTEAGFHTVRILDVSGREVAHREGNGPAAYRFEKGLLPGVYFVRIQFADRSLARKVFIGN